METPIGEPKWEQIRLISNEAESSIHLLSVSSMDKDFHCSVFKEQVLLPNTNTTFDVIFLSRYVGQINSTLNIHTSKGTFKYKIFGTSIGSPYRLISFQKLKLPINESFSSPIYFHNPHRDPIQILEMYTSGGDVHLEFPNNNLQFSKRVWIINAYETRTIMKVKVIANKIGNFTSFIRIRTNNSHTPLGFVLPIFVEVSNVSSLYILNDKIQFGTIRTLDTPKSIKVYVLNNCPTNIFIKKIYLDRSNEAISIDVLTYTIPPMKKIPIATITYSTFKITNSVHNRGNVMIMTYDNSTFSLPYYVDVIHGSLIYDANTTKFFINSIDSVFKRSIGITNTFDFHIVIYRVACSEKSNFVQILNESLPMVIKSKALGVIDVQMKKLENLTSFITQFTVYTNVSLFTIPIFVYNGKLKMVPHRPDVYSGILDFGMLNMKTDYSLFFSLRNENPIDVIINEVSSNWYLTTLSIVSVHKFNNNFDQQSTLHVSKRKSIPLILKPYHYVVFQLKITSPDIQGVFTNDVTVNTQFEKIAIPYHLRTNEGSLDFLDFMTIENCFPTKSSKKAVKVKSSFSGYLELTALRIVPNDTRFNFEVQYSRHFPILLNPKGVTQIGHVKYIPHNHCGDPLSDMFVTSEISSNVQQLKVLSHSKGYYPCYVGFSLNSKIGKQWLNGMTMSDGTDDYDVFIYKRLRSLWDLLVSSERHNFNITLQMDTISAKGFLNTVNIRMVWPSLVLSSKKILFPLTQIGNYSIDSILLENPSDKPIVVQMILLSQYTAPYSVLKSLDLDGQNLDISESDSFSFYCEKGSSNSDYHKETIKNAKYLTSMFAVQPVNKSLVFFLEPRKRRKVKICFHPTMVSPFKVVKNYIIIRNNLTAFDYISTRGEGSYGELAFQNGHNQESLLLNFELTEKHFKNCDVQSKGIPSFTVRRPFVIKNIGNIPVFISGFKFAPYLAENSQENEILVEPSIAESKFPLLWDNVNKDVINKPENTWCTGYGFEVVECGGYKLEINESLKLEIVFTPDFSLHKVVQQLQIHTSLSQWPYNVTVQASLPAYMLHRCSQALVRPDSEILIWYMAIVVITLILIAAMLISYYEADRIFTSNVIYRHFSSMALGAYSNSSAESTIFDLKGFESRNTLYSLYDDSSKSSDFSSFTASDSFGQNMCRRRQITKKHDEKCFNDKLDINKKSFSYEKIVTDKTPHHSESANFSQQKRKKKRSFVVNTIQWLSKFILLLTNQNTALKPKLENNFDSDIINQSVDNLDLLQCSVSGTDYNLDHDFSYIKQRTDHNQETTTTFNQTSTIATQQNKKSKRSSSNSCFNNSNKYTLTKMNGKPMSPLDFEPINIPADNKFKKMPIKKNKKPATSFEDSKSKSSQKIDDNCSFTDSSTDEKTKEIELSKQKLEAKYEDIDYPISTAVAPDDVFVKPTDKSTKIKALSSCELQEPQSSKISKVEQASVKPNKYNWCDSDRQKVELNSDIFKRRNCPERGSLKYTCFPYRKPNYVKETKGQVSPNFDQNKCDCESDELIEWEHDTCSSNYPEDLAALSERTEYFASVTNLTSTENVKEDMCPKELGYRKKSFKSSVNCSKEISNCTSRYQIDPGCQIHGCSSTKPSKLGTIHKYDDDSFFDPYMPGACEKHSEGQYFNDVRSLANGNSSFMSLELPGIAQGRKQSLLEYERRSQKTDIERHLQNDAATNYPRDFKKSLDIYHIWEDGSKWDMGKDTDNPTNGASNGSFWDQEKTWNHVEPGSQHDFLARNLIPQGLLTGEGISQAVTTNTTLWKFKMDDPASNP